MSMREVHVSSDEIVANARWHNLKVTTNLSKPRFYIQQWGSFFNSLYNQGYIMDSVNVPNDFKKKCLIFFNLTEIYHQL